MFLLDGIFSFDIYYFPFLTRVWRRIIQKGDIVIDATCGNGYDTLEMVKMVSDKSCGGHVFAMDVQKVALENAASLLDESLNSDEVSFTLSSEILISNSSCTNSNQFPSGCKYMN